MAADAEVEEEGEVVAVDDLESPLAVTVTVATEAEELGEIPQAASSLKVKGMFLASQSEFWRTMESAHCELRTRLDNRTGRLTGQDIGGAFLGHAAEVRLAVLLLVAHARRVGGAGSTGETAEEAAVLIGSYISYLIRSVRDTAESREMPS